MSTPFASDRPWPAPARAWDLAMRWHDLLFLHWRIAPELLRAKVPAELEVETFDGSAWLAVVPFRMSNVRRRGMPGLPWISAFPELNVRTYVTRGGRPGVWFFSLDAANPLAVRFARSHFHLPYFDARMRCVAKGGAVEYASTRTHADDAQAAAHLPAAAFRASWRPAGPLFHARAGTLEHFLTARYCLYAQAPDGALLRGEIDHSRWPLRVAAPTVAHDTMVAAHGFAAPAEAPLAHCVEQLDVVGWTLEPA
jgi:uncharacterized protein YqjF (DUF2071 family)